LIAFIDLQTARYKDQQLDGLYRQIDETFAAIPALHDTAYATCGGVAFEGGDSNAETTASFSAVSPRFFDAVGRRVLVGRAFTEHDSPTSLHVAAVPSVCEEVSERQATYRRALWAGPEYDGRV
jgi:hypothetical protein